MVLEAAAFVAGIAVVIFASALAVHAHRSEESAATAEGEVVAVEPSTRQAEIEHSSPVMPDEVAEKDDLTDIKGIGDERAIALHEAGLQTPKDVYLTDDSTIADVHGIGQYTVEQIRSDIGSQDE